MSVTLEQVGRVATVMLDRPPVNVLNLELLRELHLRLDAVAEKPAIDLLLLQGAGERAFSAGVDIKDHTRDKVPEMLEVVHGVIRKLRALPQITIAVVHGACLGGACELASACDFIVASEESSFATPEITVGCYPPVAVARFASLIGYHRAAEMILTGRTFSAAEAHGIGLVSRLFPAADLEDGVAALKAELLGKSGAVLRLTVKALRELSSGEFESSLRRSEQIYRDELLRTKDVEEGVRAFLEKRKPVWKHR
ncbi:MAG TPA: enoyl-CoA hydratase-related protein [Candidatus Binatia bacterium]